MFCKKCGTEQKDGQKYCPKCGEPYLDENGKPYLKGIKKDMQDAKDELTSKVDELTQKSKKASKAVINGSIQTKYVYIGICVALMLMVVWGFTRSCSDNTSNHFGSGSVENVGPREICITLQAETDGASGPQERMRNVISSSGNYGFRYDEGHFYTDEIIIPYGKSWTYKDYEVHYNGGEGTVPDVRYYFREYSNGQYKTYNCRNDCRSIPVFRSNDKIKIIVDRWNEVNHKTMDVKVYFVEKDDDLQMSN